MTTYVPVHGGGGSSWDFHLLAAELRTRGHDVVTVDLPTEDENLDLGDYADHIARATGDRPDPVVLAHSIGAYAGTLACTRMPVHRLVLLTAMIPAPGETPMQWWHATGCDQLGIAMETEQEQLDVFLNGVPPDLAAECLRRARDQASKPMNQPWPLTTWPDVRTDFLLCRDDRFFPPDFMRAVVRDRLGITPHEIPGGHSAPLSHPRELADQLEALERDRARPGDQEKSRTR